MMILKQIPMSDYYDKNQEKSRFISEFNWEAQIIAEYKEAEDIDTITEEDITSIFGDSYFSYN